MVKSYRNPITDWRAWCCFGGLVCAAHSACGQSDSPYDPQWERHFRIGPMVGFNLKAAFRTSGTLQLQGGGAGATGAHGVDHNYDDGYVRVDNTGNAGGRTVNWGYNEAGQVVGTTLTMHESTSINLTSAGGKTDEGLNIGMEVAYGGTIKRWDRVRLGWDLEVGFLPLSFSDNTTFSGPVTRNLFTFDVTGIPIIPVAGTPQYQGTPDGGSDGSGPAIDDRATAAGTDHPNATVTGTRKLDLDLFTITLGPSLYWDLNQWVGLAVNAGPTVGIVTGEYKFDETITVAGSTPVHNSGSIGADKVLFGGTVGAQLMFHVIENGDLYLGVKYMPLGKMDINSGGRQANLDLSGGMYVTAGFNWPF